MRMRAWTPHPPDLAEPEPGGKGRTTHDTRARSLRRRALASSLSFRRDTGHVYPHRDVVRASDAGLVAAMGDSGADRAAALATLWREVGLDLEGNWFGRCGSLLAY